MDLGLSGRVAFVTGGSKGIGLACAEALSREGVKVAIASRSRANVDAALAKLAGAVGVAADFTEAAAALAAIDKVRRNLGRSTFSSTARARRGARRPTT